MGIDIALHAEKLVNDQWSAVSTRVETLTIGGHELGSWIESDSIYVRRDRGLSNLLGRIALGSDNAGFAFDALKPALDIRGFPADVSTEVLRAQPLDFLAMVDMDEADFRQAAIQSGGVSGGCGASWLLLDELLSFDWSLPMATQYGKVEAQYASWFGNGDQPFPRNFPAKVLWSPPKVIQPPFWKFWQEKIPEPKYTDVYWSETYAEKAGERFMNHILPLLQSYGSRTQVRIIFWLNA